MGSIQNNKEPQTLDLSIIIRILGHGRCYRADLHQKGPNRPRNANDTSGCDTKWFCGQTSTARDVEEATLLLP